MAAVPAAAIFDSPRGLVYSRADRNGLWLRHRDGREELLAASFRRGDWANWELREDEVWFVDLDGGQAHLARLDLATGTRRRLSALATGEDVGGLTVAPDGSAVFFALADRSESDLMMASFVD